MWTIQLEFGGDSTCQIVLIRYIHMACQFQIKGNKHFFRDLETFRQSVFSKCSLLAGHSFSDVYLSHLHSFGTFRKGLEVFSLPQDFYAKGESGCYVSPQSCTVHCFPFSIISLKLEIFSASLVNN